MARHIFEGAEDVLATTVLHSGQLETGRRHSVANIENIRLGDRVDVVVVDAQQPIAAVGFSQQYVVGIRELSTSDGGAWQDRVFCNDLQRRLFGRRRLAGVECPDATGTEVRRSSPTA